MAHIAGILMPAEFCAYFGKFNHVLLMEQVGIIAEGRLAYPSHQFAEQKVGDDRAFKAASADEVALFVVVDPLHRHPFGFHLRVVTVDVMLTFLAQALHLRGRDDTF